MKSFVRFALSRLQQHFEKRIPQLRTSNRRLSLERYLVHTLGAIVAATILLIGVGVTLFVYRAEVRSWRDRQNEATASAARSVNLFLHHNQDFMMLVSRLQVDYVTNHPELLQDILQQTPALLEIVRLDSRGQVVGNAYIDNALLANSFTLSQSSWFLQARAGQTYLGDLQFSAFNQPYVLFAIPSGDGGVVAVRMQMDLLNRVVSEIRFGSSGQAYVVDRTGKVISHPDVRVVTENTSLAERPEFLTILQAPHNQWHGGYENFDGTDVVGSSAQVQGTDWIIVNEISRHEAYAITLQAISLLGGGVVIAGILILLIGINILRGAIFKPITALRKGAERLGRGELAHRIPVHVPDEIGEVTEAFNEMAAKLLERETTIKHARDEALQASQFKSRLLANVGHDLRTPINAILGYADIMREGVYGPLTPQQTKANGRILSNSKRLLFLINSILDEAQIEAGKLELRCQPFAPQDLLASVRDTMEIPAQGKGLNLHLHCDPALPGQMLGDFQRLQQIALNLVENAIKFTPQGTVSVRLFRPEEGQEVAAANGGLANGAYWTIQVTDTGAGIPQEAQDYIFEAFRQVDGSITRNQKGVGLGLSIVKQLALLMKGNVFVESHPDQGSTFTVILPLETPSAQPAVETIQETKFMETH